MCRHVLFAVSILANLIWYGNLQAQTYDIKSKVASKTRKMSDEDDQTSDRSRPDLDFYQFRKGNRQNVFLNPPTRRSTVVTIAARDSAEQNIRYEITEDLRQKTYAVLQDHSRNGFSNSKLRYTFLVYSNQAWKIFVLTVLVVSYITSSWLFTFCSHKDRPFAAIIVIFCLNLVFAIDVAFVFALKFSKKWRKNLNLVEPEASRVVIDGVLALPYTLLYLLKQDTARFDYHAIAPIMALVRLYRVLEYFYNKSSQAGRNQWTTFLFQYLILFLISVHTLTCIWYLFAYKGFDIHEIRMSWTLSVVDITTETTFDWYFVCAYWSVMMLTTNALGDLYPVTTVERFVGIIAILLGFLLTTIVFVGSLTSQFITITTRRSKYVRQLNKIKNHLRLIEMDPDITKRILRYYEDLWYQKSGVFKPKLLKLLPYPLQMEICYDLNAVPLYSSLVFRKLPEAFLRRLSLAMTHQFYLPGDVVYNHNQNKTIMVCITNGVLELLSDEDDESPMISFGKGTCFGEISLVYNIPARCTVKAATYVECQVLDKTEFIKLMITYPGLVDTIKEDIQDRVNRSKVRKAMQAKQTQFTLNVYASRDRKKSSIKCLKEKLRYIQGKLDVDPLRKEDYLDTRCLDLYVLSEHIRKRTTQFTCMTQKFPWILESDCYLVRYWELYMLIVVFYICLVYPYFIAYKKEFPGGIFVYADITIVLSLIFNVMMSCLTAIKTKKKYIRKFKNIISYRMNTLGFYLDMVAIIPFEYLVTVHSANGYRDTYRANLFNLCKGVKLCLVWRLSSFFEDLERKLLLNTIAVKVTKYITYICLLCYWCGCILYMEACFVKRCSENSWFSMILGMDYMDIASNNTRTEYPYVTAVYFAAVIVLSVGYGDFTPGDQFDMALVAFLSLYGVLLIGYCVAEFSAVVTHWSRTKTAFLEVIITIDRFMNENNMQSTIKSRIMAFYELQWQYNSGAELTDENWLEKTVVPTELRKKVLHQARFKALTSIRFFQVKNKAYIQTITEMARDLILPPGEIVYYGGTVSRELYVIESGYCLLTSKTLRDTNKERIIGPGNHLGLLVLLYGVPAVSTVVTLTHCKLISIGHSAYTSALSLFPDMREHDGLLTQSEQKEIEAHAKAEYVDRQTFFRRFEPKRAKITSIFQDFLDDSFINVLTYYRERKESYIQSFKPFHFLNNVSPFLLMPFAIRPDGVFLKTWAVIRVIAAFLMCLLIPAVVSMAPMCQTFDVAIVVLEAICYADIFLRLHVAYYGPKNQLIYHPYMTARYYLKGAFMVDFLICFPWYAAWKLFMPNHTENHHEPNANLNNHMFHCAIRLISILQIYKIYTAYWAESINALKKAYLMNVLQFFLLTIFFLNLYTSILIMLTCRYVLAENQDDFIDKLDELSLSKPYMEAKFNANGNMICQIGSWIDKSNLATGRSLSPAKVYLLALYWTAASFSGAGFGDITAQDTVHIILTICVNIHGVFFFGYVYASIASLKAVVDQVATKFQENLKHLDMFLSREKVPFSLKKNVIEYWKYQWKRTGGWSHQSILCKLHANLNEDAVLFMYEKTLREIPLFEGVEYSFFRAFAKSLKELYFQKGYVIMRSHEVISNMYIIYRGKVDITSNASEIEACMGPGGIFGNIKGAAKYYTQSNVVASRNIDLLCIDGPDFYLLLKSYPSVLKKVQNSMSYAKKDYVLPTVMSERPSEEGINPVSEGEDEASDVVVMEPTDFAENFSSSSPQKSIASQGSRLSAYGWNYNYIAAWSLIFQPHRWFRRSCLPDGRFVSFIDGLILVISYFDFMLLVYQMAFLSNPYFFEICVATDIVFIYKWFLDFHTGYMNRYGDYVLEPRKVRKMFFSKVTLRRRDFLSNLPLCYVVFALILRRPMKKALFVYMRMPHLFRITHLFTYRTHRKINIGSANLILKLTTIGIWASIITHINACLFFKLSCLTPLQCTSNTWMTKPQLNLLTNYAEHTYFALYVAALWYMINLLTITGSGDVSARNDFEVIETIVVIIVIKFCTGLLISEMSAMITAHSSSRIAYDYGINELRDGLRDMDLSEHQMNKMWDYVRELWNRQQGRQMPELVYELPFRLRCQVMQAVYGSHITESIIFSKTTDDFKRMLAMWMRHCVFFPGNYIVQCGDSDQCIYFIHRGEVEVLTVHPNLTESIYDILGPEDSFGIAQGLFVGVSHHFSFRARTVVDIVYLKLDQWKYLLDFYPKSAKIVRRKVENVYLAI